ncbi:WhiB family transcriptional regulator [Mycobacterium vicinigordonae]|uniref:WhiB family transcriptional regulator n=1 Tax=Mycobacterium vicinigordonae TaxID=1719132 RepID=A0A7D6E3H8_9MYCO|nr:WhiB family transcriptional regulator [Mycobacterium vicinigordonae]QLL06023.1 WhiB family transcriptional regulator [Mycobacterium vicinigordonae]
MTAAAIPLSPSSKPLTEYVPVCSADPDRWTTAEPDDEAKALCLACPRRWLCAAEACQDPNVEGLWAGVVIPESGRPRDFALRRLRVIAERGGYHVPARRRGRPRGSRN